MKQPNRRGTGRGETIVFWLCITAWIILLGSLIATAEGQYREAISGDEHLTKAMVGVWKEVHQQGCLNGESIVIYYPDKRFEEFTTYMANDDCEFVSEGFILRVGEFRHTVTTGTWKVSGGHIYYKTLIDEISSMRIISIDKQKASMMWDNGNTCESYRIDPHGK